MCIQCCSMVFALLGVPICSRAAIHLMGRVVSFLTRAAMASLPGSLEPAS